VACFLVAGFEVGPFVLSVLVAVVALSESATMTCDFEGSIGTLAVGTVLVGLEDCEAAISEGEGWEGLDGDAVTSAEVGGHVTNFGLAINVSSILD